MDIVTREEWDARSPQHAYHEIPRFQDTLILHHAAGAVLPGDDRVSPADLRRISGIQDFHIDSRGWNDIAYSFLLDPDGHAFEGRGAGVANGATKGYGASSYALCVMGNYDVQAPDLDLVEGIVELVRWGHGQGLWPLRISGGHRNYGSTSCPGSKLYPLIPEINRQLLEEDDMPTVEEIWQHTIPDMDDNEGRRGMSHAVKQAWRFSIDAAQNAELAVRLIRELAVQPGRALTDADISRIREEVADEIQERMRA